MAKPGSYEIKSASEDAQVDQLKAQAEDLWQQRGDKEKLLAHPAYTSNSLPKTPQIVTLQHVSFAVGRFYGDAYESEIEAKRSTGQAFTFGDKVSTQPRIRSKIGRR